MKLALLHRSVSAATLALVATGMGFTAAAAAPSHFNTDPYLTGCAGNSITIASKGVSDGTISMKYSKTCATNWIEWRGPRITTTKRTIDGARNQWTRYEVDTAPWSYSMQVYGPGNTRAIGTTQIGSTTWTINCASSCSITSNTPAAPAPPSTSGRAWGVTRSTNAGVLGQCTNGAYTKFKDYSGVYPALTGNAKDWYNSARATRWSTSLDAQANSIVVFQPGVQGADRAVGHVGWVTSTQRKSDGLYVTIVEMNAAAGPYRWSSRTIKDVAGMSYILAPRR